MSAHDWDRIGSILGWGLVIWAFAYFAARSII